MLIGAEELQATKFKPLGMSLITAGGNGFDAVVNRENVLQIITIHSRLATTIRLTRIGD